MCVSVFPYKLLHVDVVLTIQFYIVWFLINLCCHTLFIYGIFPAKGVFVILLKYTENQGMKIA